MLSSRTLLAAAAITLGSLVQPTLARAGYEPIVGEITFTASTFCPYGWVHADGRLVDINGRTALFSLLGIRYGGDGKTTFGVPDLRKQIVDPGEGDEPTRSLRPCIAYLGHYPLTKE